MQILKFAWMLFNHWSTPQLVLLTVESLHELEDNDLDALMADLVADLNATEEKLAAEIKGLAAPSLPSPEPLPPLLPPQPKAASSHPITSHASAKSSAGSNVSAPEPSNTSPSPPPPSQAAKPSKVCLPLAVFQHDGSNISEIAF